MSMQTFRQSRQPRPALILASTQAAGAQDSTQLKLCGIRKSFGDHAVLRGIDLTIAKGDVVALIGPSGTGKTTLLRCINFLERADDGTVTIGDHTVNTRSATEREILAHRRKTAMVFQNYNLLRNKTILQNVTEGLIVAQKKPRAVAEEIAHAEIESVGLSDHLHKYPYQLSGGQQQRIGIARAMALQPDVMLLDEPTSSLDPERSLEVLRVLQDVACTGMTMIIATHEMSFARHVSSRVVFMEHGRVVEQGSPTQIFAHPHHERTRAFVRDMENPFPV